MTSISLDLTARQPCILVYDAVALNLKQNNETKNNQTPLMYFLFFTGQQISLLCHFPLPSQTFYLSRERLDFARKGGAQTEGKGWES